MKGLVLDIRDLDPAAGAVALSASFDGKPLRIVDVEHELGALRSLWERLDDDHRRAFAASIGVSLKRGKGARK